LFYEIARILDEKKPEAYFLENVKNLLYHDKGNTFRIIKETLEELGYSVFYKVINAKLLVPQNRERVYIIGFKDLKLAFKFPEIEDKKPKVRDILEKEVPEKYTLKDGTWNFILRHAEKHKKKGHGFGYSLVDLNGYTRTLLKRYCNDSQEILIPQEGKNPRRLTPRECARLQGFPEEFKIPVSDTQAYRQFGNSVAIPIVEYLAKEIIKTLSIKPMQDDIYGVQLKLEFK